MNKGVKYSKIETTVIIVTYNSERHIGECIASIKKQKGNIAKLQIIVIDNNSTDKTFNILKKIKDITLIKSKINKGFARAVNLGIKRSTHETLLLVNPDSILKAHAIERLVDCMVKSKAAIVGGLNFRTDGVNVHGTFVRKPNIYTAIFDFTNLRKLVPLDLFHKYHYYELDDFPIGMKKVDAVSGSFMLISKKTINKIGLFDEKFFMYLEDIDYCLRAKQAGLDVYFCPNAKVIHIGGASSDNEDRINHKAWYNSRSYYARKHYSPIENTLIQPIFALDTTITELWRKLK